MSNKLTHIDPQGNPKMVDISTKPNTHRLAIAEGWVLLSDACLFRITEGRMRKGDVMQIAQLAGIMGAKRTADLIPLCHPLPIDSVDVLVYPIPTKGLRIEATVRSFWRTGVEMEALTAVTASALTVYDMIKSIEKDAMITGIRLLEKQGGRSGRWIAKQLK